MPDTPLTLTPIQSSSLDLAVLNSWGKPRRPEQRTQLAIATPQLIGCWGSLALGLFLIPTGNIPADLGVLNNVAPAAAQAALSQLLADARNQLQPLIAAFKI